MDSAEVVQNVLEHHGIKGMKWGVRRGRSSGGSSSSGGSGKSKGPVEVTVKTKSGPHTKTVVKTSGGQGHPAHPDAVASRIVQQKLQKSGMHSVSNAELQTYNNRMNLEQNAKRLAPETGVQRAIKFVNSPQGQLTVKSLKTAAKSKVVRKGLAKVAVTGAMMAV